MPNTTRFERKPAEMMERKLKGIEDRKQLMAMMQRKQPITILPPGVSAKPPKLAEVKSGNEALRMAKDNDNVVKKSALGTGTTGLVKMAKGGAVVSAPVRKDDDRVEGAMKTVKPERMNKTSTAAPVVRSEADKLAKKAAKATNRAESPEQLARKASGLKMMQEGQAATASAMKQATAQRVAAGLPLTGAMLKYQQNNPTPMAKGGAVTKKDNVVKPKFAMGGMAKKGCK